MSLVLGHKQTMLQHATYFHLGLLCLGQELGQPLGHGAKSKYFASKRLVSKEKGPV